MNQNGSSDDLLHKFIQTVSKIWEQIVYLYCSSLAKRSSVSFFVGPEADFTCGLTSALLDLSALELEDGRFLVYNKTRQREISHLMRPTRLDLISIIIHNIKAYILFLQGFYLNALTSQPHFSNLRVDLYIQSMGWTLRTVFDVENMM